MIFNLLKAFSNKILLLSFLLYHGIGISNIIFIYISYCAYKYYTEETKLIYQNTERNLKIVKSSKILKNPHFKPYFLLSNHFLQIIFQKSIYVKCHDLKFTKEKVKNSGAILEWIEIENKEKLINSSTLCQDKILFIIPGLTGGKHDNYICNISYEGIENNYIVVVYQNVMLTEELFHPEQGSEKKFDFFEDLDNALNHVQTRYPNKKIYAVGYSYGANKLVKYLGTKNVLSKRIYCAV
jgi:predicted alpha/beta-fold hydrolase